MATKSNFRQRTPEDPHSQLSNAVLEITLSPDQIRKLQSSPVKGIPTPEVVMDPITQLPTDSTISCYGTLEQQENLIGELTKSILGF